MQLAQASVADLGTAEKVTVNKDNTDCKRQRVEGKPLRSA